MKLRISRTLFDDPPAKLDWIIFAVLAVACYLLFQHTDLLDTGGQSLSYLSGHFLDFYDYNKSVWGYSSYLPSTYFVFALWNIPLRLLGMVSEATVRLPRLLPVMWYKLLPTLFYLASAYVIYKMAVRIGLGERKSRLSAYAWLTTPVAFFSQFIFGQYDTLGLFLLLVGLYSYLKKDLTAFALYCGIAFTFKYFALFFFVPLLLLSEKDVVAILKRVAVFAAPTLLELALYVRSPAFWRGVFGTPVPGYVELTSLWNGYVYLRLVVVAWILLCAWAYFVEPSTDEDTPRWGFYFVNLSMFLLFGLSMIHPQWLIWAAPIWVLTTFMNRRTDIFLALDVVMMLFLTLFTINFSPRDVDQQLFGLGMLKSIAQPVLQEAIPMKDLLLPRDASLAYSLLSSVVLINAVFKHPRYCRADAAGGPEPSRGLIRTRFIAGVAVFVIPAAASLILALNARPPFFVPDTTGLSPIGPVTDGRDVRQTFIAKAATITRIEFLVGTYGRINTSQITLSVESPDATSVVYKTTVDARNFADGKYWVVGVPDVHVTIVGRYILVFAASNAPAENAITLYRTSQGDVQHSHYAIIDGQRQAYDLAVKIFGN
jgi:hypothetical protein